MDNQRLKSISFLKGMAIILVILVHSSQSIHFNYENTNSAIKILSLVCKRMSELGQLGCQLFFAISALTICLSWKNKYIGNRGSERGSLTGFYKKRFLAIAPGYYTIIVLGYLINVLVFDKLSISQSLMIIINKNPLAIIANILFIHGVIPWANNNVVCGGWYIGTTMIFYLMFPALFAISTRWRKKINRDIRPLVFISLAMWIILYIVFCLVCKIEFKIENNSFQYFFIGNQMPVLLCGFVLYFLREDRLLEGVKYPLAKATVFFAATIGMWIIQDMIDLQIMFAFIPVVVGIGFSYLFIYMEYHFHNNGRLYRMIEKWGRISYSAYLVHLPFAWIFPALIVKCLERFSVNYNGAILWLILLIPMYAMIFIASSLFNKYLKCITPLFAKAINYNNGINLEEKNV